MFMLIWPLIIIVTLIAYALLILILPFSPEMATVILFGIVGFWSKLPGTGMQSPFLVLYWIDLLDVFSLVISINMGGHTGAIFILITNVVPRVCGFFPSWIVVVKDTLSQFIVCLIIPYVHVWLGGDIFKSMVAYSIIRYLLFYPMRILPNAHPFPQFVINTTMMQIVLFFINSVYVKFFGSFFDNLLQKGVKFNWLLFFFVSFVIFGAYFIMKKDKKSRIKIPNIKFKLKQEDEGPELIKMADRWEKEELNDIKRTMF